jgi:hypothetical protein
LRHCETPQALKQSQRKRALCCFLSAIKAGASGNDTFSERSIKGLDEE